MEKDINSKCWSILKLILLSLHLAKMQVLLVYSKDFTVNDFLFCHNGQVKLDTNIFQCNNANEAVDDC